LRLDLLFAFLPEFLLKPTEFALAIIQRSLERADPRADLLKCAFRGLRDPRHPPGI
jgi:hypothetical protein